MQFKHPEIIWALFLLIIPILVHLFQLRRFQKVAFTNVKFLKKVELQTRKSSQLKKWLTLLFRLLALTALVIAFAQPFTTETGLSDPPTETIVYLDNSFSMQARGKRGPLLKRAVQELIASLPEDHPISLITNNDDFKNVDKASLVDILQELDYSANQLSPFSVTTKAKDISEEGNTKKQLLWISDFQQVAQPFELVSDSLLSIRLVQLQPENIQNTSIDSATVTTGLGEDVKLQVSFSSSGPTSETTIVALYDNDKLIGKSLVALSDEDPSAEFSLKKHELTHGRLQIEDNGLAFDNELFFSINTPEKINSTAITEGNASYLRRIFTDDEFNHQDFELSKLDYNQIASQQVIVLNELPQIPKSLQNILTAFASNGGVLLIIPNREIDEDSYNELLNRFSIGSLSLTTQEKKVTTIAYDHPLYGGVFEGRTQNFQYPNVKSFYRLQNTSGANVISYEDGSPFLAQKGNVYLFTASLSPENSNFKGSPLIVPTLYNIGRSSLKMPKPYFVSNTLNAFDIKASLASDQILTIENEQESFIPLQRSFNDKVRITTDALPNYAGNFQVKNNDQILQNISYNYPRSEHRLRYANMRKIAGEAVSGSVTDLFDALKSENSIHQLWKWFVIFALCCLLTEMAILKFFA